MPAPPPFEPRSETPPGRPSKGGLDPAGNLAGSLREPLALVGFGVEGRETLRFLRRHGVSGTPGKTAPGKIVIFDHALDAARAGSDPGLKGFAIHGKEEDGEDGEAGWGEAMVACKTVVRSPGVRPDHPAIVAARKAGARITSATELFLEASPGAVVGVTGTLGKGTTVSLIVSALNAAGVPARGGGNIGINPLAFLEELTPESVTVLELSSFQLMDLTGALPGVAVVLRSGEEHLDWHSSAEEYRAAKSRLLAPPGSGQRVIYCADSHGSREIAAPRLEEALAVSRTGPVNNGIGMRDGRVARYRESREERKEPWEFLPQLEQLALPGAFNLENAAAAWLATEAILDALSTGRKLPGDDMKASEDRQAALDAAALDAIATFPGLPHRLEAVGEVDGIACYNDSYATRPDATLGAVSSFDRPLALILGGSEKHADFTELAEALSRHPSLRRIVLIGATAQRISRELRVAAQKTGGDSPPVLHADTLPQAFAEAWAGVPAGGVLLFSPACASFDMFANYKVRGEAFKALVARAAEESR